MQFQFTDSSGRGKMNKKCLIHQSGQIYCRGVGYMLCVCLYFAWLNVCVWESGRACAGGCECSFGVNLYYKGVCVFVPLPVQTLSVILVSGCCCCQHTLQLLGYRWGRYNVGSFPDFIAFNLTLTSRLPVCTFYNPSPPLLHSLSLTLWTSRGVCKPMMH